VESLCNLVRSTLKLVLFSGIFTLVPVDDVRVMVFTSTMKERRLVLGGGVSGVALHVMLSVALPLPPQFDVQGLGFPLHETKATADSKSRAAQTFRKFIEPPRQSERQAQIELGTKSRVQLYRLPVENRCKSKAVCSTAKCGSADLIILSEGSRRVTVMSIRMLSLPGRHLCVRTGQEMSIFGKT
jgi:hypothetical protein